MRKEVKSIVLVTNILTPYRSFFYQRLYQECQNLGIDFNVLVMRNTSTGRHWQFEDYKTDFTHLMDGYPISVLKADVTSNHINPKVEDYIKQFNPQIIVLAGGYLLLTNLLIVLKRKSFGAPIIFWSESHLDEVRNFLRIKYILRDKIRKFWFNRMDGYWYAGEKARELIDKYSKTCSRYYFLPNLIDAKKFSVIADANNEEKKEIRESYSVQDNKKLLFCPARVDIIKGIHKFMDVLALTERKGEVVMIVAGDGNYMEEFKQKAKDLSLDIRFVGYKNQNEIIELYKASDIFVLPSLSDPNPLSVIEALWGGKPLIVSKHVGNYPEAVHEQINGIVIDYSQMHVAAKKVDDMISKGDQWLEQAKTHSLQIAHTIYNPDLMVPKLLGDMMKDYNSGLLKLH